MNDAIWLSLCKTDPAHTKHVSQRGGFTTVDAYHQIERMTQKFGPAGKGWGWEVLEQGVLGTAVWLRIMFWWLEVNGDDKFHRRYQTFGGAKWKTDTREMDPDEAYKKALTDALTKAMSYLGMNADIFQGRFDDNKYVEQRQQEVRKEKSVEQKQRAEANPVFKACEKAINSAKDQEELTTIGKDIAIEHTNGKLNDDEQAVLRSIWQAKRVFLTKSATTGAQTNAK